MLLFRMTSVFAGLGVGEVLGLLPGPEAGKPCESFAGLGVGEVLGLLPGPEAGKSLGFAGLGVGEVFVLLPGPEAGKPLCFAGLGVGEVFGLLPGPEAGRLCLCFAGLGRRGLRTSVWPPGRQSLSLLIVWHATTRTQPGGRELGRELPATGYLKLHP